MRGARGPACGWRSSRSRCAARKRARARSRATGRSFTLGLLPFDIADALQRHRAWPRRVAWIFTSATLTVGEDFSHFAGRIGLPTAATAQIPSPFDYENQALLFLPRGMPDPTTPEYLSAVVDVAMPLIEASGGGAFFLFTSHRALARAAELVRSRWDPFAGRRHAGVAVAGAGRESARTPAA
jgi:Rad3-related DNA helicase